MARLIIRISLNGEVKETRNELNKLWKLMSDPAFGGFRSIGSAMWEANVELVYAQGVIDVLLDSITKNDAVSLDHFFVHIDGSDAITDEQTPATDG